MTTRTPGLGEPTHNKSREWGSVRVTDDCYVSAWVIACAPFQIRPANAASNGWRIVDRYGVMIEIGHMTELAAQTRADQLNELAATAIMMKGVQDGLT